MKYSALLLIGLMIVVFVVQLTQQGFTDEFVLDSSAVAQRPWTLMTSVFLHGSFEHLFYNMFALGIFGIVLENLIGTRRFLIIFMLAGLCGSVASLFFYNSVLGASGAIFGVMGALVAIRPKMTVFALGVPMPMFVAAIIWAGIDVAGVFEPSGTANLAHLAGLGLGIVFSIIFLRSHMEKRSRMPSSHEEEINEWEDEYMKK